MSWCWQEEWKKWRTEEEEEEDKEGRTGLWRRTTAEEIGKTYHSLTDHIYLGVKKHSKIKKKENKGKDMMEEDGGRIGHADQTPGGTVGTS